MLAVLLAEAPAEREAETVAPREIVVLGVLEGVLVLVGVEEDVEVGEVVEGGDPLLERLLGPVFEGGASLVCDMIGEVDIVVLKETVLLGVKEGVLVP